ncbi:hypothetical protein Acr_12g0006800 [Actinidia rufa]|uniref:Transmembrane protein n=1 Tax=Actinidia rufa TaxID=165716 RepID=A0A7J0FIW3_9ERIC|nr:hypothetical protein Acr_12g0006800 [Actinidia rufa]
MGQSLKKLAPGSEEKIGKEIGPIIENCYDTYLSGSDKDLSSDDFYRAVCVTIGEINKKLSSSQFRVPGTETLKEAYNKHHQGKGKSLTKDEFQKILQEVILESGFSGIGAIDIGFYIFGVPLTALFIKQGVMPRAIPNEIFIPVVTSAAVFVLAMLNKI